MKYSLHELEGIDDDFFLSVFPGKKIKEARYLTYFLIQDNLTSISKNVVKKKIFKRLYLADDNSLLSNKNIDPGNSTRLDVILLGINTNFTLKCLRKEGNIHIILPHKILIEILLRVSDPDTIQSFYLLNKSMNNYMVKNSLELIVNFAERNKPIKKMPENEDPTEYCEFISWIREFFYSKQCHKYIPSYQAIALYIINDDIKIFLEVFDNYDNYTLLVRYSRIIFLSSNYDDLKYLVKNMEVDIFDELFFWSCILFQEEKIPKLLFKRITSQGSKSIAFYTSVFSGDMVLINYFYKELPRNHRIKAEKYYNLFTNKYSQITISFSEYVKNMKAFEKTLY